MELKRNRSYNHKDTFKTFNRTNMELKQTKGLVGVLDTAVF